MTARRDYIQRDEKTDSPPKVEIGLNRLWTEDIIAFTSPRGGGLIGAIKFHHLWPNMRGCSPVAFMARLGDAFGRVHVPGGPVTTGGILSGHSEHATSEAGLA